MKHAVSKEIIQMTRIALDRVGEDSFNEDGPDQIMDLSEITEKFKNLTLSEKIKVSSDLKEYLKCSETLIHILMRIQYEQMEEGQEIDQDELNKIVEAGHSNLSESFPPED